MDVRIGSIETTVVDSGQHPGDEALVQRIVTRVLAMLEQKKRHEERAKKDRAIESPDPSDIEDYG
jgi:hypothetical protein